MTKEKSEKLQKLIISFGDIKFEKGALLYDNNKDISEYGELNRKENSVLNEIMDILLEEERNQKW